MDYMITSYAELTLFYKILFVLKEAIASLLIAETYFINNSNLLFSFKKLYIPD